MILAIDLVILSNETLLLSLNEGLKTADTAEKAFWKQRSRQLWLKLGDLNTTFFHASGSTRYGLL